MFFRKIRVAHKLNLGAIESRTLFYDSIRQGIEGGGESLASVFFLYIAIEIFELPSEQKALLVASRSIGFCLAPFIPLLFSRSRLRRSHLVAYCNLLSGLSLFIAALAEYRWEYTLYCSLFVLFLFVKVPLLSYIYRKNYRSEHRGRLFSLGGTLRNICNLSLNLFTAIVVSQGGDGSYRWILVVYSLLILFSAFISFLIPSQRFCDTETHGGKRGKFWIEIRQNLWLVLRDKLFLYICLAWYLLGFGNLALGPMKVEFLLGKAAGSYGAVSPIQLVLILQILPGIVRSVGTIFGGRLFDRIPLLLFRILTNLLFMAAIILFFQARSWWMLFLGMVVFGLAESGAQFIWNLWITHLAPDRKQVELYMGVHVFLNGTRGVASSLCQLYFTRQRANRGACPFWQRYSRSILVDRAANAALNFNVFEHGSQPKG